MNEMQRFGALIRDARLARGWDQDTLGRELGKDKGWVSRLESGKGTHPPDPALFRSICLVLSIPMRTLVEALGYLDPEQAEPGIAYAVPEGSARAELLDTVKAANDAELRYVISLASDAMGFAALARSAYSGPRAVSGKSIDSRPTNRSA